MNLINDKIERRQKRFTHQKSIDENAIRAEDDVTTTPIDNTRVDWFHFITFLETYMTKNIEQMSQHMNPFVLTNTVQFKFDPLYNFLTKFFVMSHSLRALSDSNMPLTRNSITNNNNNNNNSKFSVFEHDYEIVSVYDLMAFTRKNDLMKSFCEMILLEEKEFATTKTKLIDMYYHLGRFSLELCYLQKNIFFTEFKRLFNSANKELVTSDATTREKNITRTSTLRRAAKKQHFDTLWLNEVSRLDYERRLRDVFIDKNVTYKPFSLDEKLVESRTGTADHSLMEEFPAMLLTNGYGSFEPGVIICNSTMFHFVSFANRDNKTHVSVTPD
jgi:hypothetical protein